MLIKIGGAEYPIRFVMSAWKEMEEDCGLPLSSISDLSGDGSTHDRATVAVKLLAPLLHAGTPALSMADVAGILEGIRPEEYGLAVLAAGTCIRDAMRMQQHDDNDEQSYDPVLRRLDAEAAKQQGKTLTWRRVSGWGLIAGISLAEQTDMLPGMVMDMYLTRRDYDDEQHGIRRKGQERDELLDAAEDAMNTETERGD